MISETAVQCSGGAWVGDFWEHSAVVRELARHLVHPSHPLLALHTAHEFYSPYALTLAVVSRVTGLSPVNVLGAAGLVNLALLLLILPRFVRLFTDEPFAPFLTLLFTLVWWGEHPLVYSGFLHFDVIGFVLPYPSTFGLAAALWAAVIWHDRMRDGGTWRVVAAALLAALVLLTHPVAALFLGTLLVALTVQRRPSASGAAGLAVVAVVSVAAAAAWPYYPFFRLLREESVFDSSNHPLYISMLPQLAPILPLFLLVPFRLRRDGRDPMTVTVAALVAVYLAGWATSHWSLGRVLPYGVLLLHVALAAFISSLLVRTRAPAAVAFAFTAAVVALAVPVMKLHDPFVRTLPESLVGDAAARPEPVGRAYARLYTGIPRETVTMATAAVGWPVPTFGDRIVDPLHPQAFVNDLAQRDRDVVAFFDPSTSTPARRRLLCAYHAAYILVRREQPFIDLGPVSSVYRTDGPYVLRRVRSPCAA